MTIGARQYPARAILAVAAAGLLFAFDVASGFLFIALMLPMIPVFIGIVLGGACLLGSALEYAAKVSIPAPTAMLPASKHEPRATQRSFAARAA
jgi:hypothetical protein